MVFRLCDVIMMSVTLYHCFRLVFGTLYPAYKSYKAVKTKNVKEYVSSFAEFEAATKHISSCIQFLQLIQNSFSCAVCILKSGCVCCVLYCAIILAV